MTFNNKKYTHPLHTKVTLYLRPNSPFWWCSFYQKGRQFRVSTKSKTKHDAEIFSGEWFIKKQAEIITGVIPHKQRNLPTIKQASIKGLDDLWNFVQRGDRTERYYYGVVKYMNKHILPHFEDMAVEDVTPVVWYEFINQKYMDNPAIARNTLHQMRNSLRVCLTASMNAGWITQIPVLTIKSSGGKTKPRVWFNKEEQILFLNTLDEHVEGLKGTPHYNNGLELRDRVRFFLYSGLRVSELNNVRFKDINYIKGKFGKIILIKNIRGKRGTGSARCDIKLNGIYDSIVKRRTDDGVTEDDVLFKRAHREMLNVVLHKCNLKHDEFDRTRDFVSLRHTYICNKILEGKMSTQDIAINCRTSSDMIYEHYARWLDPELMHSINEAEEEIIEAKIVKVSENNLKLEQAQRELKQAEDKIKLYEALQENDPDLFVGKVNPEFTQPEENKVSTITENVDADMEKLSEEYGLPIDKIHELLSEAV